MVRMIQLMQEWWWLLHVNGQFSSWIYVHCECVVKDRASCNFTLGFRSESLMWILGFLRTFLGFVETAFFHSHACLGLGFFENSVHIVWFKD